MFKNAQLRILHVFARFVWKPAKDKQKGEVHFKGLPEKYRMTIIIYRVIHQARSPTFFFFNNV